MGFKKGNTYGKGRIEGSKNKLSANKQWMQELLETDQAKFEAELKTLEGKDYCTVYLNLMDYIEAKMQRIELGTADEDEQKVWEISFRE